MWLLIHSLIQGKNTWPLYVQKNISLFLVFLYSLHYNTKYILRFNWSCQYPFVRLCNMPCIFSRYLLYGMNMVQYQMANILFVEHQMKTIHYSQSDRRRFGRWCCQLMHVNHEAIIPIPYHLYIKYNEMLESTIFIYGRHRGWPVKW